MKKSLLLWYAFLSFMPYLMKAQPNPLPELSDQENDYWYYISFSNSVKKGCMTIQEMGSGSPIRAQVISGSNNQLWKFVDAGNNRYHIISKSGTKLAYSATGDGIEYFYTSSDANAVIPTFAIANSSNEAKGYLLEYNGEYMNPHGGLEVNQIIRRFNNATDQNSSLTFIPEDYLPKLSNGSNEYFYCFQNTRRLDKVLYAGGSNPNVIQSTEIVGNRSLWKLVGSNYTSFKIVNKETGESIYINVNENKYYGSTSQGNQFSICPYLYNGVFGWSIYNHTYSSNDGPEYRFINDYQGSNTCNWSQNDGGSTWRILTYDQLGLYQFSNMVNTENWYFIKINRSGKVIQSNGSGNETSQATQASSNYQNQLWKFVKTSSGIKIVGYNDEVLKYHSGNGYVYTMPYAEGDLFEIQTYSTSPFFQLKSLTSAGSSGSYINDHWNEGQRLSFYSNNDGGNALSFVKATPPSKTVKTDRETIDFSPVMLGDNSTPETILIQGRGISNLRYEITGVPENIFSVTEKKGWKAANGGYLDIIFTPLENINYNATLKVYGDNTLLKSISLSGKGINKPIISIEDPQNLSFGEITIYNKTNSQTILVSGIDIEESGIISYQKTGNDVDAFSIEESEWDAQTGGTLSVSFTPSEIREYSANIVFTSSNANPITITLTGKGKALPFTLASNYYIQFANGNTILADLGEKGARVSFPNKGEENKQLWKIAEAAPGTGTYFLETLSGNKLSLEEGKFKTSGSGTPFRLKESTVTQGAWELEFSVGSGLSQDFTNVYAGIIENPLSHANNAIHFIKEKNMDCNLYPIVPQLDTPYYIHFKASGLIIQYEGIDNELLTNIPNENNIDIQKWKLSESDTPGQLYIETEDGSRFYYDNKFYSSKTNVTPLLLVPTLHSSLKPAWEIEIANMSETLRYMNINGGSNPWNDLGVWYSTQSNNVVEFVSSIDFDNVPELALISNETDEYWYYIQYKNSRNVIQDMGDNQNLVTRKLDGGLDQLWKINGQQKAFNVNSKGERSIIYNNSEEVKKYQSSSQSFNKISIQISENVAMKPAYMLYTEENGYGQLSEDNNNIIMILENDNIDAALQFILSEKALPSLPTFSNEDETSHYHIQFKSGKALEDTGSGLIAAAKSNSTPGQMWKLTGTPADFTLESGLGNKLSFNISSGFGIDGNTSASFALMINPEDASKGWEIKYKFNQGDYHSSFTNYVLTENDYITAAEPHDSNNYFDFITFVPETQWSGQEDNSWDNVQNWTFGLPVENGYVVIPATTPHSLEIPSEGKTIANLTFERGATIDLTGDLTVTNIIKVEEKVTNSRWYTIGFPFELDGVYYIDADMNVKLDAFVEGVGGDFWLQTLHNGAFNFITSFEGVESFIAQYPNFFINKKITYISETGAKTLSQQELPTPAGYRSYELIANPNFQVQTISSAGEDNNYYYIYDPEKNNYALLREGTYDMMPFEAIVMVKESDPSQLKAFLNLDNSTGINDTDINPEIIKEIHYYNLQGNEIKVPVNNELYIVKYIFESGKEERRKEMFILK